jgi:hypothetical protein
MLEARLFRRLVVVGRDGGIKARWRLLGHAV